MKVSEIKSVAVIGAGIMGHGIALEFARFGYNVGLFDIAGEALKKAMIEVKEELELMVETGLVSEQDAENALARIQPGTDFEKAVANVQYVVEAVPERMKLKQEVFAQLDRLCPPDAILATNTSALPATDIASLTPHPERVLVTHYYSPPHLMPLVEVVGGQKTSPETIETSVTLLKKLRKRPVVIDNETLRQIGTALQNALTFECHRLVDKGILPQVVDDITTFGFGRRLGFQGYFKRLDIIGLDGRLERYMAQGLEPWKPLLEHVEKGELGAKTGKGFYDWSPEDIRKTNRRLNIGLINFLKQDMEDGVI